MPTDRENLVTARSNAIQQLADLSNPLKRKPSYSIAGRSVQWVEYQRFLTEQVTQYDKLLAAEDSGSDGGFTVTAIE